MTGGCYSYYEFKWGKYLRVDTSARFRCYALTDGRDVTVYQKGEEVFRFSLIGSPLWILIPLFFPDPS